MMIHTHTVGAPDGIMTHNIRVAALGASGTVAARPRDAHKANAAASAAALLYSRKN